jgi:hypothetical protein
MTRIGYFSIRGYWRAPLAVFAIVVLGGIAVPGGHGLGFGLLGVGAAYGSIIAFILSIVASQNQSVLVGMMCEVDSSLQLVSYSYDVWGNTRFKMNSARGEWQVDIPNLYWGRRTIFRGPNELYRVIRSGPEFSAEVREMMESAGSRSAGT